MVDRKTKESNSSVREYLDCVQNERRRKDSFTVSKMMKRASRKNPKMWGPSIVGFGKHHFKYSNGEDGEICKIGFAPRSQAMVFYLANYKNRSRHLQELGKHKVSGGGCIYINKLDDVDLNVLEKMFGESYTQGN